MQNYLRLSFVHDVQDQVVGAERLGAPSASSFRKAHLHLLLLKLLLTSCRARSHGRLEHCQAADGGDSQGMYAGAVARDGQVPADASVVIDVTGPEGTASLLSV